MASRLVVDSRDGWLTPGSASDPRLFHADPSDRILLYPAGVGEGYRQYITLSDDLTTRHHELHHPARGGD